MDRLAQGRSTLFDQEAERYDRYRPTHHDTVLDELVGSESEGLDVLDVGCGTGIASRLLAQRGAKVSSSRLVLSCLGLGLGHLLENSDIWGWRSTG
jgi:2-polyprenyl-3-methyl-5-hydroxy-6-metoxy-1,4-benzoquinol methylase